MLTPGQRLEYLINSTFRYFEKIRCPYCLSEKHSLIDKKYIVTRLFECEECHLLYRHPVEKVSQNKKFYEADYKEMDKITTSLPDTHELQELIDNDFVQGNKNAGRYIDLFRSVFQDRSSLKIIDYGCSWGYIPYQIQKAGFDVQGFEISRLRAEYGKSSLQVDIKSDEAGLRDENDIFFSSHVIEHHPDIKSMIGLARKLLKPDGYFIAISPNGSKDFRIPDFSSFHLAWGKVHPNYLTADFYKTIFRDNPYYIGSSPFNASNIKNWDRKQIIDKIDTVELIVVAKLNAAL